MADQTSASIEIAAPPDAIMRVIADFDSYPEWVDSISRAEVLSTADGHPKTVRMTLDHALVKDTYVLGFDWSAQEVNWRLLEASMLKTMDGSYQLRRTATGTSVTYTLKVDINMPMIGMFKRKAEKTIVDGALKGLKKRVEG